VNRLILWDIDRTLVACGPPARRAIERAAERALAGRVAWADGEAPAVTMSGRTDPAILLDLLEHGGPLADEDERDDLLDAALRHLENELAEAAGDIRLEGRVLPGVADILARVAEVDGVIQTVVTGNIRANAAVKVGVFGLDRWLDLEIGAYGSDHADRNELVPLARARAAAKHGPAWATADAWVIGDTLKDLACARAAGGRCLLVATGQYGVDELSGHGAEAVLPDLSDVDRVVALLLAP
jgi:phosphoglycolate phosphatase-like HAD superfamily hydrolase